MCCEKIPGPCGVALLLEDIGVSEARRILVRVLTDRDGAVVIEHRSPPILSDRAINTTHRQIRYNAPVLSG